MLRPVQLATATLALALTASGALAQSTGESAQSTETAPETAATLTAFDADTLVATVGDTPITLGEVIAVRQTLPEQYQQLPDEVLMTALVQQMADQQALANAAEAAGLKDLRSVRLALANQLRAVLADAWMAQELLRRVDEAAIEAAYQERFASAEPVEEVRAAHILVETVEEAEGLKAKLDQGADFAALAAEHGTDGTASRGGDLGWFQHAQMVPEFADAVFAMETGTISAPVESPFGWHLIKLEERRQQPVPELDAVREQIIGDLTEAAQNAIVEDARAATEIVRPDPAVPDTAVRQDALIVE